MKEAGLDKNLKLEIIFESPDFLIINKPANLLVHPAKISKQKTLIDLVLEKYPQIRDVGDDLKLRPGLVHRLDKNVSGLIVVAKTQAAFDHFKNEFKNRRIEKKYLALVYGQPQKEKDIITTALVYNRGKTTLAKSIGLDRIKESWTEYEVIKKFKDFSLLKVKIKTGRTHQIRLHLKSIGCPIVGDKEYKIKRQKFVDLDRIFLHSYKLGFYDLNGEWQEVQIDLPKELNQFLEKLEII